MRLVLLLRGVVSAASIATPPGLTAAGWDAQDFPSPTQPLTLAPTWNVGDRAAYQIERSGPVELLPGVPADVTVLIDSTFEVLEKTRRGYRLAWTIEKSTVTSGVVPVGERLIMELQSGMRTEFFLRRDGTVDGLLNRDELKGFLRNLHEKLMAELSERRGLPKPREQLEADFTAFMENQFAFDQTALREVQMLFACLEFSFTSKDEQWYTGEIPYPSIPCFGARRTANLALVDFDANAPSVKLKWRTFDEYSSVPAVDAMLAARGRSPGGDYVGAPRRTSVLIFDVSADAEVERATGWPERVTMTHVTRGDVDENQLKFEFRRVPFPQSPPSDG